MQKTILQLICFFLFSSTSLVAQEQQQNDPNTLILECYQKDQEVRKACEALSTDSKSKQQDIINCHLQAIKIDTENQQIAFPILDQYLKQEIELSSESLTALYYIIQHADGSKQEKYQSFVAQLFKENKITNQEYAWFTDRLDVRNNRAQTYGFQVKYWTDTQDTFPYPIIAASEKNTRQIALESSKSYMIDTYTNEYSPQYVEANEFVLFGHIKKTIKPHAKIVVNSKWMLPINEKGFYSIKIKKLPTLVIQLVQDEEIVETKEIQTETNDWFEVDFL